MKHKEYVDALPKQIKDLMLSYQEQQGNRRDITVFYDNIWMDSLSGGFDWTETRQGMKPWSVILSITSIEYWTNYKTHCNNTLKAINKLITESVEKSLTD